MSAGSVRPSAVHTAAGSAHEWPLPTETVTSPSPSGTTVSVQVRVEPAAAGATAVTVPLETASALSRTAEPSKVNDRGDNEPNRAHVENPDITGLTPP